MEPDAAFDEERFRPTPADNLPAADLTELLGQAGSSPAHALEFFRRLLLEPLAVLAAELPDDLVPGRPERVGLTLLHLSTGELPVFTSRAQVFAGSGLDPATTNVVGINGRELLASLTDQAVVLNPFSTASLVLPPPMIAQLLSGDYLRHAAQGYEMTDEESEAGADIGLMPAEYAALTAQLTQEMAVVLRQQPRARQAYLVWQLSTPTDPEPGPLVLLVVEGDSTRIAQELGYVGRDLLRPAGLHLKVVVAPEWNYFQESAATLGLAPFYEE